MFRKWYLVVWLGLTITVMGCGNEVNDSALDQAAYQSEEEAGNEANAGGPIALIDDLGHEVLIPNSPERIIAPYLEDDLLTIDVLPIAQWSLRDGASIQDYLQDQLAEAPVIPFDLPFEAVTQFEPDLIILNSAGLAEGGKYDTYAKMASTFVIESEKHTDWRQRLRRVAEIFNKEQAAEEKLAAYDALAEELKEKLKQAIGEEPVIALWWFHDTFYVVNVQKSSGEVLYQDLELTAPNVVKEITANAEENWLPISLERLAELDAQHIFLITSQAGEAEKAFSDNVFQHIPAVKSGNVYEFTMEKSWLYSGYIANTQIMEDIAESLLENIK